MQSTQGRTLAVAPRGRLQDPPYYLLSASIKRSASSTVIAPLSSMFKTSFNSSASGAAGWVEAEGEDEADVSGFRDFRNRAQCHGYLIVPTLAPHHCPLAATQILQ